MNFLNVKNARNKLSINNDNDCLNIFAFLRFYFWYCLN
jgi:hypothetical protein